MSQQRNILVVMTALVPTIGHKYLIDFASRFGDTVHVVISVRSFEPRLTLDRVKYVRDHYKEVDNVHIYQHLDDDAPQNDDGTSEFWDYWKRIIDETLPDGVTENLTHLCSSENYGKRYAEVLGLIHIPVDIDREIVPISGTMVRQDLSKYFKYILPEYRKVLSRTICITGIESSGKTTMSKWLANKLNGQWVHEWARPFLTHTSKELNEDVMLNIVYGQSAAMFAAPEALFTVLDTDLTATEMYYDIGNFVKPDVLLDKIEETCHDTFYIIMNDKIPFEPDILRYGGDVRESAMDQWVEYYESRGLAYHVVTSVDIVDQRREVMKAIYERFESLREIEEFERD